MSTEFRLRDLVAIALDLPRPGKVADQAALVLAANFLSREWTDPFLPIPLRNANDLKVMCRDGLATIMGPRICAIYGPDEFPVARVYYLDIPDLFALARTVTWLRSDKITVTPHTEREFDEILQIKDIRSRVACFLDKHEAHPHHRHFNGLLSGRLEATFVDRGFLFRTKGCLFCGEPAGPAQSTVGYDTASMIGALLCPRHLTEAMAEPGGITAYIFKRCGCPVEVTEAGPTIMADAHELFVTDLGCQIEKENKRSITAIRPSGVKIVFRHEGGFKYAYVFFDRLREQRKRIDAADHHDVVYGPDHLHLAPEQDNSLVAPSFTYGHPRADLKTLVRILAEIEGAEGS